MDLREEIKNYLFYCQFQKKLNCKTIKAYQVDLNQFVAFIEENGNKITKEHLNLYLVNLHNQYKPKSAKRKIASAKAFFAYLLEEEKIELNPFHIIKTKFKEETILPKIIARNRIEELLNYLYSMEKSEVISDWNKRLILRDIAVIEMLFATGLRISELCNLQDSAFDRKNGVICIYGKGAKERYLQIGNENVLAKINEYRDLFSNEIEKHGYFFVNRYGKPLSEQAARRMIHKHTRKIFLDVNITPHMFRHSFATFLMEEDVNIIYLKHKVSKWSK